MTSTHTTDIDREVVTAVKLETDLGTPLLLKSSDSGRASEDSQHLHSKFRWHGLIVGFLAQLVNVSGSTYMFYKWGSDGVLSNLDSRPLGDILMHAIVWLLTQVDLYLYIFMWMTLTAVLTHDGMQYVRRTYFSTSSPSKRSIFVLGVQFYVGVVFGVFLSWTGIDCLLGLPVPLMPMFAVLFFGLCISYVMVWCYDMEEETEEEMEDEGTC